MHARRINPKALLDAKNELKKQFHRANIPLDVMLTVHNDRLLDAILRTTLLVYADSLKANKVKGKNFSEQTYRLVAMKVDEVQYFDAQPMQSLRGRMKTARGLMKNPQATWTMSTVTGKGLIKVTRLPDGARLRKDPSKNPKVLELVSMKVGDSFISKTLQSTRSVGQMGSNTKIMARRMLEDPNADWIVTTTTKGIRLTRIK